MDSCKLHGDGAEKRKREDEITKALKKNVVTKDKGQAEFKEMADFYENNFFKLNQEMIDNDFWKGPAKHIFFDIWYGQMQVDVTHEELSLESPALMWCATGLALKGKKVLWIGATQYMSLQAFRLHTSNLVIQYETAGINQSMRPYKTIDFAIADEFPLELPQFEYDVVFRHGDSYHIDLDDPFYAKFERLSWYKPITESSPRRPWKGQVVTQYFKEAPPRGGRYCCCDLACRDNDD